MKMLTPIVGVVLALVVISGLYGCGSGINTVTSQGSSKYTRTGDVFLDDQIALEEIRIDDKVTPKTYNLRVRSKMWFNMVLEVKMDFYDESGVKMDNPWGWKPVTIEPKQDEWVKFTAPSNAATDFKLYVKKAER